MERRSCATSTAVGTLMRALVPGFASKILNWQSIVLKRLVIFGTIIYNMLEKDIENKYRLAVKTAGGLCLKLLSPSFTGIPDRLTLLPGARIWFCEFKYGKGVLSPRQIIVADILRKLGFEVKIINEKNVGEEIKNI